MKFLLLLSLCAIAAAAPQTDGQSVVVVDSFDAEPQLQQVDEKTSDVQGRNILINALIRQLFAYIRNIINNGSILFGVPPLDPLLLEEFHLQVPAGLINLDLELKNAEVRGIGGFVVHRSNLNLRQLTFDLDISVPELHIKSEVYDLNGDLLTAIPIYGNGFARFEVKNFRFQAILHLGQSEDGKSVIIKSIESPAFQLPHFKSNIEGAIGGGDIDVIVNAIVEEVLIGYINRFHGAVSQLASQAVISLGNPILEQLDTWRFIAPLM